MINSIILAAVVLILIAAVKGSIRHMKGEGGCCGGGNGELPEREKKLEGAVVEKKILHIEGMTCAHCVNRVMAAVNKIDGASAKANLRKKLAVVSCDRKVDENALKQAVEKAGYQVKSVETQ